MGRAITGCAIVVAGMLAAACSKPSAPAGSDSLAHPVSTLDALANTSVPEPARPVSDEALAWMEHNEPDLVITDYRMPDMTGAQFTREFRRHRRLQHVPVVVVTAADERAVRYAALEAGAVDFLAKPIDPLEVRTRCRNLLLLMHQHRLVRDYSELQDSKLDRLQALLHSLTGNSAEDLLRRTEKGEMVTVPYDKLFAITSCVAGAQELVAAAQRNIADLEAQLTRPLRGDVD